jgi:hypothetical protein
MPIVRSKANAILSDLFQKTYYIGLSKTTPSATGGNVTEPSSSTGYKRMPLDVMGTPSDGQIQNTDIIFFPESLSDWGTITHFVVYSGQSGSVVFFGALNSSVNVPTGYVPIFRAGALKVGLDKDTLA